MTDTNNKEKAHELVSQARKKIADDMTDRGIGAIIWNIGEAGFHYIPEIVTGRDKDGGNIVKRITGLYNYEGELYAIEEGAKKTSISNYYRHGVEIAPTVVTLSADLSSQELGNPTGNAHYTRTGSDSEWLTIADCYFEALNEK